MSNPVVSSYDDALIEAFGRGYEDFPEDKISVVKTIVEEINNEVIYKIEDYMRESMLMNLNSAIRDAASKVAGSMLANALAGDDDTIKTLFGFNDWYLKHIGHFDNIPTQWKLIDAIVDRRPDVFFDERLKQRDAEIASLQSTVIRLKMRVDQLQEEYRP